MLSNSRAEAAESIQMNIVPSYSVPEELQGAFDVAPDPHADDLETSGELDAQETQPAGASPIRAAVYAIAGVYTSPDFMAGVLHRMTSLLNKHTPMRVVRSQLLYPYGDWSASLLRQIRQVRGDLARRKAGVRWRNSGGQRLPALLEDGHGRDIDKLLLIGHSAGRRRGRRPCRLRMEPALPASGHSHRPGRQPARADSRRLARTGTLYIRRRAEARTPQRPHLPNRQLGRLGARQVWPAAMEHPPACPDSADLPSDHRRTRRLFPRPRSVSRCGRPNESGAGLRRAAGPFCRMPNRVSTPILDCLHSRALVFYRRKA